MHCIAILCSSEFGLQVALLSFTGSYNAHTDAPSNGQTSKLCPMNASFTDVIDLLLKSFRKNFWSEKGGPRKSWVLCGKAETTEFSIKATLLGLSIIYHRAFACFDATTICKLQPVVPQIKSDFLTTKISVTDSITDRKNFGSVLEYILFLFRIQKLIWILFSLYLPTKWFRAHFTHFANVTRFALVTLFALVTRFVHVTRFAHITRFAHVTCFAHFTCFAHYA